MSEPSSSDKSKSLLPDNLFWPEARRQSDPVSPAPPPAAEPPAPVVNDETVFRLAFDVIQAKITVVPKGLTAEPVKTEDGTTVVYLSGVRAKEKPESGGRTDGFSIRVPDSFEAAASGNRVRVTVIARAPRGAEAAEFSLAYSTSEVGNSGWRKFTAGSDFEPKGFEWDVPTMKNGNGDYVGILPADASGLEIELLTVEAIPRD